MAYCRNCGKPLATEAVICPACGVPSNKGNAYCWNCGNAVSALAEMCVKCGVRLSSNQSKKKSTAIILSIFLSFWSWLYTYKRNAWKFWLAFGLNIVFGGTDIFLFNWYYHVENPAPFYLGAVIFVVIVWLWALLDNAIHKKDWYLRY